MAYDDTVVRYGGGLANSAYRMGNFQVAFSFRSFRPRIRFVTLPLATLKDSPLYRSFCRESGL